MMQQGDHVRVTGVRGTVLARVQSVCPPAQLPQLPQPAPNATEVAAILEEFDVDHIAMLSYEASDKTTLVFAAIRAHGLWRDMRGQLLEIEPAVLQ